MELRDEITATYALAVDLVKYLSVLREKLLAPRDLAGEQSTFAEMDCDDRDSILEGWSPLTARICHLADKLNVHLERVGETLADSSTISGDLDYISDANSWAAWVANYASEIGDWIAGISILGGPQELGDLPENVERELETEKSLVLADMAEPCEILAQEIPWPNDRVRDLHNAIVESRGKKSMNEIAREITGEPKHKFPKAQALLQSRRDAIRKAKRRI